MGLKAKKLSSYLLKYIFHILMIREVKQTLIFLRVHMQHNHERSNFNSNSDLALTRSLRVDPRGSWRGREEIAGF